MQTSEIRPVDLDLVDAIVEAATPGPWRALQIRDQDPNPANHNASEGCWYVEAPQGRNNICDVNDDPQEANADLIASAPSLLKAMADELRELRKPLDLPPPARDFYLSEIEERHHVDDRAGFDPSNLRAELNQTHADRGQLLNEVRRLLAAVQP